MQISLVLFSCLFRGFLFNIRLFCYWFNSYSTHAYFLPFAAAHCLNGPYLSVFFSVFKCEFLFSLVFSLHLKLLRPFLLSRQSYLKSRDKLPESRAPARA